MKEWNKVLLLTLAGLGFRVLHLIVFANELVADSDQLRTIELARKFAAGNSYGVLDPYWPPLYPILIGTLTYFIGFIDSPILPALIIATITGALAIPLTYYLAKQSYGREREATLAAVLAIFFPHLINSVFSFGTENIYLLLVIGALILGWKGLERKSTRYYLFTGLLLGLAYLTRPEAIGYTAFFALLAFGKNWWDGTAFSRSSITQLAALVLGFALLATPYFFYLHSATGTWTISAKAGANSALGDLQQMADEGESAPDFSRQAVEIIHYSVSNVIKINKDLPFLLPPLLLIFVALGLFSDRWDKERLRREVYLILFCLLTAVGYAMTVVQVRYFYILLPIFFGWMARGIFHLEGWYSKSVQSWVPNRSVYPAALPILGVAFIYLYTLPINYFMVPEDKAWQAVAYEERDAGLWLKKNSNASSKIFSASSRPAFYAGGSHMPPTTTDVGEILRQIKGQDVDYVVTGERSLKRNPYLKGFTEILRNDPDFELIYEKKGRPGYEVEIFKLRPANAGTGSESSTDLRGP
jgi:4-amino-4-deoxy-L-arabinose transferase-like glycosyltransferase